MVHCEPLRLISTRSEDAVDAILCPRLSHCDIHRHPMLHFLSEEDIAGLCMRSRLRRLPRGAALCEQGEPAAAFYLILSGRIKYYRLGPQGTERVLGAAGPGDAVGADTAYSPGARFPWHATCLDELEVRQFQRQDLLALVEKNRSYREAALDYLAGRIHWHLDQQERLTHNDARERLVQYLLRELGGDTRDEVDMLMPKNLVARHLAMEPETLSRLLKRLSHEGLIAVDRQRITLRNRAGLTALLD